MSLVIEAACMALGLSSAGLHDVMGARDRDVVTIDVMAGIA